MRANCSAVRALLQTQQVVVGPWLPSWVRMTTPNAWYSSHRPRSQKRTQFFTSALTDV